MEYIIDKFFENFGVIVSTITPVLIALFGVRTNKSIKKNEKAIKASLEKRLDTIERYSKIDTYILDIQRSMYEIVTEFIQTRQEKLTEQIENVIMGAFDAQCDVSRAIIKHDLLYNNKTEFTTKTFDQISNLVVNKIFNLLYQIGLDDKQVDLIIKITDESKYSYIDDIKKIRKGEFGDNGERIEAFKKSTNKVLIYNIRKFYETLNNDK